MGTRKTEYLHYIKTLLGVYAKSGWDDKKLTFIVSTGRTATWFLVYFLNKFHHAVDARHEPDPNFLRLGVRYARGQVSFKKTVRALRRRRQWIAHQMEQNNRHIYIEANNNLFSLVPSLWEAFPHAKVVHIVRDGRDFVRSVMTRGHYTDKDKIFAKKNLRLQAEDFPDDIFYYKWEKMSLFEKACWEWFKKDEFIYKATAGDERARITKFEDIFDETNEGKDLYDIMKFMDVAVDDEMFTNHYRTFIKRLINHKELKYPHWSEWEKDKRLQFYEIAGLHMKLYGYDLDDFIEGPLPEKLQGTVNTRSRS